jgi:hypothetical protein
MARRTTVMLPESYLTDPGRVAAISADDSLFSIAQKSYSFLYTRLGPPAR